MRIIKQAANILTLLRIILSFMLLLTASMSLGFIFIYSFCGVTDMLDGTIARKTHTESKLGAKLDSIADIVFILVAFIMLFPIIYQKITTEIIIKIIIIAITRVISYIIGYIKFHRFSSLHTIANKITGFLLFCCPYFLQSIYLNYVINFVCMIAMISAIDELMCIIKMKSLDADVKGIFKLYKREK